MSDILRGCDICQRLQHLPEVQPTCERPWKAAPAGTLTQVARWGCLNSCGRLHLLLPGCLRREGHNVSL